MGCCLYFSGHLVATLLVTVSLGSVVNACGWHNTAEISTESANPPVTDAIELTSGISKKGAGLWYFTGATQALSDFQGSWWYNWKPNMDWVSPPTGVQFIPMIWDETYVTSSYLSEVKTFGSPILLGYNEPDHPDHANMTVSQALQLWPQLMNTGMQLCSPATANNPSLANSWQEQFMNGVKTKGYRVDKLCVHWYGSNFDADAATQELKTFLEAAYAKYQLPIWLTEFALTNWAGSVGGGYSGSTYPSTAVQADFVTKSTAMLDSLSYVEKYAWFSFPKYSSNSAENTYLYNNDGTPSTVGIAYRNAENTSNATSSPTAAPTATATATPSTSAKLLSNPGLEISPSLAGWSVSESVSGVTYTEAKAHSGSLNAVQWRNGSSTSTLSQTLTVANGTYKTSCWIMGKSSNKLQLQVRNYSSSSPSSIKSVSVSSSSAYKQFILDNIVVTSGKITLAVYFAGKSSADFARIDDCEVYKK